MRTSPKLGLRIWNLLLDPYDHEQLADNWAKVDAHDHSPGRGVLIPTEGIAFEAISFPLIATSVYPVVSAEGGEITLTSAEEVVLAGGPELTVPATGMYEIGLQLRAECKEEHPSLKGNIQKNGSPHFPLFAAQLQPEQYIQTTNFGRAELLESDVLTVSVAMLNEGETHFSHARISIWRVA
jgi:hypothetical protein